MCTITVNNIDADLLRHQRDYMISLQNAELEGVINLLDTMLDIADGLVT